MSLMSTAGHHGQMLGSHSNIWIEQDSVAHRILISVIMNRRGIKVWNKQSRRWSSYTVTVPKDYSYMSDMQSTIVRRWLDDDDKGLSTKRVMHPSDPQQLRLVSGVPASDHRAAPGASSQQET
eukprot:superscaffoldBa00002682_g14982